MHALRSSIALLVCCFVAACSVVGDGDVTVNFGDVVDRRQNLMFTFDDDMVPDSLVQRWDTTQLVRISPAVPGKFKWVTPRQLVFSPGIGFAAATAYTAELTQAIVAHAPASVQMPENRTFAFHTPWVGIDRTAAQWAKNDVTGIVEVRLTLAFNYSVDPVQVGTRLHIQRDGADVPFSMRTDAAGTDVVVSVPADRVDTDDDLGLLIRVDKGLRSTESETPTTDDITTTVQVPSRRRLDIIDVRTSWEGSEGIVDVVTSQAVDPATLSAATAFVTPTLALHHEVTSYGFRLRGPFIVDNYYTLTLTTALRGIVGGVLSEDLRRSITFEAMSPGIAFASPKAMYLGARGSRGIGMRIMNVPRIRVTVFKIYENNILHFLREARRYSYDDDGDGWAGYETSYIGLADFGDTVYTREYATVDLGHVENGVAVMTFDVQDHTDRRGMYLVKAESTEDQWVQATKIVAVSDVGLIAKQGPDQLTVFANSIDAAQPLDNVELTLISTNNQVVDRIRTDDDGVARLDQLRSKFGSFKLGMITARHGEDFTFLVLRDTRVDAGRFETGGLHENASGFQAFVYGDRDLYRPGESIHLNTIVRDRAWKPVRGVPMKLVVRAPNGRELRTMRLTLDDEGSAAVDVPVPAASVTGMYQAEIYTATDVLLTSRPIAVEEFLPDRIKVMVGTSSDAVTPGVPIDLTIDASYFFGPPAAKRSYEVSMLVVPRTFAVKRYPSYAFDVDMGDAHVVGRVERTGTLDDQGRATERFVVDSTLRNSGLLQARFFVTVFDESGRPVHRFEQRDVRTQPVMFGVKRIDRYHSTRQNVQIPIIACGYGGEIVSAKARVRIIRNEWHSVMERDGNSYRYVTQKRELVMIDRLVDIRGDATTFPFTPSMSGEYEVRVSMPDGGGHVAYDFYAFGWGDTESSSFAVNTEGFIDITLDKPLYKPGETAKVLFTTPFAGTLLVTLERDGVLQHHTIKTDRRSASMSLKVDDAWTPNIYIAATLIKPHAESDMPLTVAHGYQPLMVERPSSRLNVAITAPERSRSQRKQTIKVQTTPGAHVTIAVVDEGILQVRNTPTPDPHAYFYQKRALQVDNFDMYPFLFPELRMRRMAYGAGDDMSRRLNPFTAKRVNLVTFWSGIIAASSGTATIDVDLPAFSGALRVMAVAYKGAAFGSASKTMTVADPVVLSTSLPRVLAPGDSVDVPVMIANTTTKAANVTCKLNVSGPLQVIGGTRTLSLQPNADGVAMFRIVGIGLGAAKVTATADGLGETFTSVTEIAVRPTSPLAEESGTGVVMAGKSMDVRLSGSFVSGTARGRLIVSTFPAVQITKNLGQLLGYPHGCVEQTISKAFPQIYFADLVKAWRTNVALTSDPVKNVQEAVRKVESMQGYNGGVTYWPGGSEVTWWGTAYAAHFLAEARRAGYDVDERIHDRMLQYLSMRVRKRETEEVRRYIADGSFTVSNQPARDVFYSLFVLAAAGRQDVPTMNYYKSAASTLPQDGKYLLACTYLMLGDKRSYQSLVPKEFKEESFRPFHGGSFASPVRDMALALYALVTAAPDDAQTATLARRLSATLQRDDIYSTQENAFAVLALGKLAQRAARGSAAATVTSGGKTIAKVNGGTTGLDVGNGSTYTITASGGTIYYVWSMEGVRADGQVRREDRTLEVRRTFLDRDGRVMSGNVFKQNDVIVVRVTVRTTDRSTVDNVVVSDVLPAGLELENPRLHADASTSFAKDAATAQYYDYRDDRMNLFVRADGTTRSYYYVVRAVSKGRFMQGPIGADAMYDDDVHSYHGGGVVTVQ
jgi:alpha-2-macroglobulin